jgi:colicin import membrane protein
MQTGKPYFYMRSMNYFLKNFMPTVLFFAAAATILFPGQAMAQTTAVIIDDAAAQSYSISELKDRYPPDSIQSSESAATALAEVKEARANIEARYQADRRACYPKFFTTACLNKATERRRLDLSQVSPIEIEANAYVRKARVVERDRKLAEKAAKEGRPMPPSPPLVESAIDADKAAAEAAKKEAQRKARAEASAKKVAQHAENQRRLKEGASEDARQRAENIEKYQAKVRESEARQKEVAKRKAEKAAKALQHQDKKEP